MVQCLSELLSQFTKKEKIDGPTEDPIDPFLYSYTHFNPQTMNLLPQHLVHPEWEQFVAGRHGTHRLDPFLLCHVPGEHKSQLNWPRVFAADPGRQVRQTDEPVSLMAVPSGQREHWGRQRHRRRRRLVLRYRSSAAVDASQTLRDRAAEVGD